MKIEEDVPLGAADDRRHRRPGARTSRGPSTLAELEEALALGGRARRSTSSRSGSARTCSSPTTASTRSCSGSTASSPTVDAEDGLLVAGGGATNAVCLHRARAAGLGGFEFACAIPGTIGGGVRMNAGAYGGDWQAILERALVVSAEGAGWRTPAELGLEYRRSGLRPGEVVARAEFRLEPRAAGRDQGDGRRAPGAAKSRAADEQAHVRERLQEPGARAFRRADARSLRAQGPPDRRRADLPAARELHRERRRGAAPPMRSR